MAASDPLEWILYDTDLLTRLAILPAAQSHLYLEYQEPGSGEIRIPQDSASAAQIANGQFVACYYHGAARGGFFVDHIKEIEANQEEGGGRWMSVSGRGLFSILDDAIVWDDGSGGTVRAFTAQTKGYILKTLLDEAIARGALTGLAYDFGSTGDSTGTAWTDSEDYDINVGQSLLDVMRTFAKTGEIEFSIQWRTSSTDPILLSAWASATGTNRSNSVFMRIGSNCEEVTTDERGDEVKNVILTKYKDGYTLVSDATSIAARRRREAFLSLEQAQSAGSAVTYASARLTAQKDPKTSLSVRVYDGVSPYLFTDYNIGDTITVDKFGTEVSYRVLGVQADFTGDAPARVVLELNSVFYDNELRMRDDLDDLLNRWNTARDDGLTEVKQWLSIGEPNGEVNALFYSAPYLYVGGDFTAITGRLTTTNIARYNVTTGQWSAMDAGITAAPVVAIVEHGGDIYAATGTRVYHFTGGAWSILPDPEFQIYCMASFGTNLYIGGAGDLGGLTVYGVAYWDGSAPWNGSLGYDYVCNGFVTYNSDLYAGFDTGLADGLRHLDGGSWSTVLDAPTNGTDVECLAVVGSELVYAGGVAGTGRVYRWDGSSTDREDLFSVTVYGTNHPDALAVYLSDIYYGSVFTSVDGTAGFGNIARYSGGMLINMEGGISTAIGDRINALTAVGSDIYAGGTFTTAGGRPISNLAVWVTSFESLVTHLSNGSAYDLGAGIHAATPTNSVTDNDEFPMWEDTAQDLRKITWGNLRETLATTYFKIDASNGPITGLVSITPAANVSGLYIETAGAEPGPLDAEQYNATTDDTEANVAFLYRSSTNGGSIPVHMLELWQAISGGGTITGDWIHCEQSSTDFFSVEPDGSVFSRGYFKPNTHSDSDAPNGSIYFSSTANKLVYKDGGGTVNNLY